MSDKRIAIYVAVVFSRSDAIERRDPEQTARTPALFFREARLITHELEMSVRSRRRARCGACLAQRHSFQVD